MLTNPHDTAPLGSSPALTEKITDAVNFLRINATSPDVSIIVNLCMDNIFDKVNDIAKYFDAFTNQLLDMLKKDGETFSALAIPLVNRNVIIITIGKYKK
ncbi:MAG: hypothetical protein V1763_02025 [Parcubacteria group bacterium]